MYDLADLSEHRVLSKNPDFKLGRVEFVAMIAMMFATIAFSMDAMLPAVCGAMAGRPNSTLFIHSNTSIVSRENPCFRWQQRRDCDQSRHRCDSSGVVCVALSGAKLRIAGLPRT